MNDVWKGIKKEVKEDVKKVKIAIEEELELKEIMNKGHMFVDDYFIGRTSSTELMELLKTLKKQFSEIKRVK